MRRRKEDIAPLAAHFLELARSRFNRPAPRLTRAGVLELQRYDWPGNVRELQNVVERAVITSRSRSLNFDLPRVPSLAPSPATRTGNQDPEILSDREMKQRERENIRNALRQTGWKIYGPAGAAELLDMKPTTLVSRIKKYSLQRWNERRVDQGAREEDG